MHFLLISHKESTQNIEHRLDSFEALSWSLFNILQLRYHNQFETLHPEHRKLWEYICWLPNVQRVQLIVITATKFVYHLYVINIHSIDYGILCLCKRKSLLQEVCQVIMSYFAPMHISNLFRTVQITTCSFQVSKLSVMLEGIAYYVCSVSK